jgi:hypothetical protein
MSIETMQAVQNQTTMEHLFYQVLSPTESQITGATNIILGSVLLIGTIYAIYSIISNAPAIGQKARQYLKSRENHYPLPKPLMPRYHFKTYQPVTREDVYLAFKRVGRGGNRVFSKLSHLVCEIKTNNQTGN